MAENMQAECASSRRRDLISVSLKEHEHETVEKNMKEINSFITVMIGFLVSIIAFLSALFTMI